MSKPVDVDVVAVLRRIANAAENYSDCGPIGAEYDSEELARLKASGKTAIDAVAELIAAVESEQAAATRLKHAKREQKYNGLSEHVFQAIAETHQRKRAEMYAALAACKPANGESS